MKELFWAGAATLLFPTLISDSTVDFSNSIFSLCAFAGIYALLRYAGNQEIDRRMNVFSHVLGMLYSAMTAFGYALVNLGSIPYTDPYMAAAIVVFAHVAAQMISFCWLWIGKTEKRSSAQKCRGGVRKKSVLVSQALYKRPLLLFLLLLLCWTPCYISTFPGNFTYDASLEYHQYEWGYLRNFPLLHSALITRILRASEVLTGSVNPGIAFYTIAQMMLIAALYTHILRSFYRDSIHPAALGALTAYCALFPTVHLIVTCTTRDVLFSALVTWAVYLFYRLARNPDAFMASAKSVVLLATVLVFTLLARSNNSGPVIVLLLVAICGAVAFCYGRKRRRSAALFVASALGMFCMVNGALVALCQPLRDSSPSSSLSMMAQPIVRAYTLYSDSWPEEDREEFESYFTMETLEYVPQNADPAKGNMQVYYRNLRPFLAFWVKIGLRHPECYMDAILATTREMWFPGSVIDGYRVRKPYWAYEKDYFYFGAYLEDVGSRMNLLPRVFSFYEHLALMISFEKIPVVSMLFSIGFQFWLLLFCAFHAAYRRRYCLLWPLTLLLLYALCSSFAPLVLVRYFAALFLAFPLTAYFTLYPSTASERP